MKSYGEKMLRAILAKLSTVFQPRQTQEFLAVLPTKVEPEISPSAATSLSVFSLVGHELRTPVNAIVGYAELLQQAERDNTPAQQRLGHTNIILENARNLQNLLNQILDAARAAAGELSCTPQDFDLAEALETTTRKSNVLTSAEYVTVKLDLLDGIIIHADPVRIDQALSALLDNAIRFSTKHQTVTVKILRGAENNLNLLFTNNGQINLGDNVNRLFSPFTQASEGLSRTHNGLGLGLFLAKSIAQRHGGDVDFVRHNETDTCVRLMLPADCISWPKGIAPTHLTTDCNSPALAAN